jgi:hypothetical protein
MPLTKPRQALAISKFVAEEGRPSSWWILTATDGSRLRRVTEVLMSRPIWLGCTPACSMARLPAETAASSKVSPSAQLRRSCTPATRCNNPLGRRSRLSTGASRRSISSEVVTRGAIVVAKLSNATLRCVVVAFPSNETPALVLAESSAHSFPVSLTCLSRARWVRPFGGYSPGCGGFAARRRSQPLPLRWPDGG